LKCKTTQQETISERRVDRMANANLDTIRRFFDMSLPEFRKEWKEMDQETKDYFKANVPTN
jgi:hypothetical protein